MHRRLLLLIALLPGFAAAAGLEVPDRGARALGRGGAFAARADDPTAVDYNPGALSKLRGANLTYSHSLLWHHARFTRAETRIPTTYDNGVDPQAPVSNEQAFFPLGVFFAATHDLGLSNWTFALSVYGPSYTGNVKYPVNGGQRYMLTQIDARLIYYGASAAYGTDTFGVGATAQYVDLSRLRYSLVVDGQPGGDLNPYASGSDVEATMALHDRFAVTALAGAWWRPAPWLELGLSGRVLPLALNATGSLELRNVPGQTEFTPQQLAIAGDHAALDITLPPTARLGVRYRHLEGSHEVFDVELDLVYEAWSFVDAYAVDLEGQILLFANEPAQDVQIEKRWRDTLSARLGGTWAVVPDRARLSAGGFWERGATPQAYTNLDYLSVDRWGLGVGAEVTLEVGEAARFDLVAGYSHVFQEDRVVDERFAKVVQQRPVAQCPAECGGYTGVPANAGRFESAFDLLALAVNARW